MIDYIVFPIADIGEEESAKIEELNLVLRKNRANEGDPLEIYTEKDGEVIFKKYSLIK